MSDASFATDVPDCPKTKFGDISLGNGVVIHKSIDNTKSITLFIPITAMLALLKTLAVHTFAVRTIRRRALFLLAAIIACAFLDTLAIYAFAIRAIRW